jgi:hypothetical protein
MADPWPIGGAANTALANSGLQMRQASVFPTTLSMEGFDHIRRTADTGKGTGVDVGRCADPLSPQGVNPSKS